LLLAGLGCAETDAGRPELRDVSLRIGAVPAPPPTGEPLLADAMRNLGGWEPVALPDVWNLRRRAGNVTGWYRGTLDLPPDRRDWVLLLDGSWRGLEVFASGEHLGGVARGEAMPPLSYPTSGDLMVPLPAQGDRIELWIHYQTAPSELGLLVEGVAGPRDEMTAIAQRRALLRSTIPNALALVGLVGGVLVLLLARFSQERGAYWFGAATSLWCLAFLLPAEPSSAIAWLGSVLVHGFVPAVAIAVHRVIGERRPWSEAVLVGSVAIGAALRAVVAPVFIPAVDILWWIANFFIGLYLVGLAFQSPRMRQITGARWILFAGLILVAAGAHDVGSMLAGRMLLVPFSLFAAATPVIAVATAGTVVTALARALREVRSLNTELEERVEEKGRALAASWARTAELERERAIAAERERMMRDMHDGTGGQLVSALSLVEGGEFRPEDLAETLRAALADLRLSIDSLETGPSDLLALLALARTRLESRLEHHGLRFAWEVEDVPAPAGFGPEQSLHVLRIFQEAVTNALKHARAKTIAVRTGTAHDAAGRPCVFVEIADDGRGHAAAASARNLADGSGRGLRNMRRRAQEIGGECTISSSAAGTTVRLLLPLGGC